MADEDLIFRMEGLDNGHILKDCKGDSDEEDNYFICPITDDYSSSPHDSKKKKTRFFGSLPKANDYGTSSSPRNSFNFRVCKNTKMCGSDRRVFLSDFPPSDEFGVFISTHFF